MTDPCRWCDGKTVWNGSKFIQMSRCKEEDSCSNYQQFLRQKEEEAFWQSEMEREYIKPGIYASDLLQEDE